jgi:hypothetical protein
MVIILPSQPSSNLRVILGFSMSWDPAITTAWDSGFDARALGQLVNGTRHLDIPKPYIGQSIMTARTMTKPTTRCWTIVWIWFAFRRNALIAG